MTPHVSTIEERLARWRAFIDGEVPPGFLFHVNFPVPEWDEQLPDAIPLWRDNAAQRVERRWAEYELQCRKAQLVDDDRVPCLSNSTGTEIFAEAFGCKVHLPEDTNPFALPFIHTAAEADRLQIPEVSTSSLAYLFDMADELYRRGGPDVIMRPVDIQSPMDVVALIWNKAELFIAMIETPEAVRALAEKVRALMVDFFDEWFGRYGTTFGAHYPGYIMQGGITMSVDEVGAVSGEMFRAFFRDELVALSEHFGGIGIHCCADARHQWDNFRDIPGLKLINHNLPPVRDPGVYIPDSLSSYGAQCAQMPVGWTPEGPPEAWPSQFPEGTRVIFEVEAEDADEAAAIAERLQETRRGQ